jgi:putative restriction endonuclease
MGTWKEDIVEALRQLGGEGHYSEIYPLVAKIRNEKILPPSWKQIIRRTIEVASADSENHTGKENLFYSVEGIGSGVWGLVNYVEEPEKEEHFDKELEVVDVIQEDEYFEGTPVFKMHVVRERDYKVIRDAKQQFIEKHGNLFCEVCEFNFAEYYGDLGLGFIEAHHTKPISEYNDGEKTKVSDILMVCSNCHRMYHRQLILDKNIT